MVLVDALAAKAGRRVPFVLLVGALGLCLRSMSTGMNISHATSTAKPILTHPMFWTEHETGANCFTDDGEPLPDSIPSFIVVSWQS